MKQASIRNLALVITILGLAAPALAQGTGVPAADPSGAFPVAGTVISFTATPGAGTPLLLVDDPSLGEVEVGLGPVWYLQEQGFTAAAGDQVEALAYPCPTCAVPQVAAWVNNITAGLSITLRDEVGFPVWKGNRGKGGQGGAGGTTPTLGNVVAGWAAIDMEQVSTVTGSVVSVTAEVGAGYPTLVLATGDEELALLISPYRLVTASGLVFEPGMELTVTFAPAETASGTVLLAISLTDPATGIVIQLRDPETGFPLTAGGTAGQGTRSARRVRPTR